MILRLIGFLADIRSIGLRKGLRYASHRIYEAFHEWRRGIRTYGLISPADLGFSNPDIIEYTPVTYSCFGRLITRITIDRRRDVFLDYGCGKGRAIILAAAYPFRRIVGVELSPTLAQMARENVARVSGKLACKDIEIVTTDATLYTNLDDVTVIFMYNPFRGAVLSRVIANIRESLLNHQRNLTIVCVNHGAFDAQVRDAGWVTKQEEFRFYPNVGGAIYKCLCKGC
jgi:SAM-dependent methyltransferase